MANASDLHFTRFKWVSEYASKSFPGVASENVSMNSSGEIMQYDSFARHPAAMFSIRTVANPMGSIRAYGIQRVFVDESFDVELSQDNSLQRLVVVVHPNVFVHFGFVAGRLGLPDTLVATRQATPISNAQMVSSGF
jgi:hypothetical protein